MDITKLIFHDPKIIRIIDVLCAAIIFACAAVIGGMLAISKWETAEPNKILDPTPLIRTIEPDRHEPQELRLRQAIPIYET